jgi:hypothetical protein
MTQPFDPFNVASSPFYLESIVIAYATAKIIYTCTARNHLRRTHRRHGAITGNCDASFTSNAGLNRLEESNIDLELHLEIGLDGNGGRE